MFELTFDIFSLSISIAVIIALTFVFLLLFSPGKNTHADRFLAALLFIIAIWNVSILTLVLNIHRYAIGIIWVPMTYTLALGPCFYFYVRYVTDIGSTKKPKIWPHFIPVVFEVGLFFIEVYQGIPQRLGYFQTETYLTFGPIVTALAMVSLVIYGYFALTRIKQFHQWVDNNYSHYNRYNLNWLVRLSLVFMLFLIIWLYYFLNDYLSNNFKVSINNYDPLYLVLAFISIWLSIEAFSKPNAIYPDQVAEQDNRENLSADEILEKEELQIKGKWLKDQIEKNSLYLDPELSLKSLADNLSIHPNLVSKIINDGLKLTFSDCINDYRVRSVIRKLENDSQDNSTFLSIAFESGFNSKTTFNRVFKRQIGLTPLQYRKNLKK